MTDCISNSPSKLLAVMPLAVPDTLDIVTKSPSIAPCVASVTVTVVDPEVVLLLVEVFYIVTKMVTMQMV